MNKDKLTTAVGCMISGFGTWIASKTYYVSNLDKQFNMLHDSINKLDQKIEKVETSVQQLRIEVKNDIAKLDDKIDNNITKLDNKIDLLRSDLKGDIAKLDNKIDQLRYLDTRIDRLYDMSLHNQSQTKREIV